MSFPVTDYSELVGDVALLVPSCPDGLALKALRWAGREFCRRSQVWVEDLDALALVAGQGEYPLTHDYEAQAESVVRVRVNGRELPPPEYQLANDLTWLRFTPGCVPQVSTAIAPFDDDTAYARGAESGYGGRYWQATRATGPGLRDATAWQETVDGLLVTVVLRPEVSADSLPQWLMERYAEVLVKGARATLLDQAGVPWSDLRAARLLRAEFEQGCNNATCDRLQQFTAASLRRNFRSSSERRGRPWRAKQPM